MPQKIVWKTRNYNSLCGQKMPKGLSYWPTKSVPQIHRKFDEPGLGLQLRAHLLRKSEMIQTMWHVQTLVEFWISGKWWISSDVDWCRFLVFIYLQQPPKNIMIYHDATKQSQATNSQMPGCPSGALAASNKRPGSGSAGKNSEVSSVKPLANLGGPSWHSAGACLRVSMISSPEDCHVYITTILTIKYCYILLLS